MSAFLEYLLDLVTALIVLRMLFGAVRQLFRRSGPRAGANRAREGARGSSVRHETARDPVCGMFVSTELSHRLQRDGVTLHFCSEECREAYEKQHSAVS